MMKRTYPHYCNYPFRLKLLAVLGWMMTACVSAKAQPGTLLSRQQYEVLFPHRNKIYTYDAFLQAAQAFPLFCGEGDAATRKKELAAFLAHVCQETGGGWEGAPDGKYKWGLVYTEELACKDGHCTQYNTAGTSAYQPVSGKSYHGRGPLQISYAYNYGLAGEELHLPLLQHPELASTDGTVAFLTAIWFWMRAQKPKPSCHDVMTGHWQPSAADRALNWHTGFGMTIYIINGGIECNATDKDIVANKQNRIDFYRYCTRLLGVTAEADCDCRGMVAR
jgi:chitinase